MAKRGAPASIDALAIPRSTYPNEPPTARRVAAPCPASDTTDGDALIKDEVGLELADLEEAKAEAARALGEIARDILPDELKVRELAVDVRDAAKLLLFRTSLKFEIRKVR
jgi:hypothetical protein